MLSNYVIYKGSGGLIHMLNGIAYCADWCKQNNHILLIDIINHKAFQRKFSDYFYLININYIEDYNLLDNELNKNISIKFIQNNEPVFKVVNKSRSYWLGDTIISKPLTDSNDRIKVYCGSGGNMNELTVKYIRVKPSISNKFKYPDNIFLGVHFRNTDRRNSIDIFIKEIKLYNIKKLYLATDDYSALDKFKNALSYYEIITYTTPINMNGKCIHFNHTNQDELITNLLIDIYALLHCSKFILSSNSLISKLIFYMRYTKQSIFENKN